MVILPGLSVDNKEDTGSQKKMGSHRGKQQKRDPRDQTGHESLREKENLGYRSVGRMLAWYAEVLDSIPTTTITTKKWEHGDILASLLSSERPI